MDNDIKTQVYEFFSQFPLKEYKKGEVLLKAGENPKDIFYLQSGHVQQKAISQEGEETTIHLYSPGSYFPLFYALNKTSNTYYFEAFTEVNVYMCPCEKVVEFLSQNPEVLMDITKRAFLGLSGLSKRIESMTFGNARERVASILIYLARHFGEEKNTAIEINQRFTHQEIALLAGLTRERVSLELEGLTKEGVITITNHLITINDSKKLKDIN